MGYIKKMIVIMTAVLAVLAITACGTGKAEEKERAVPFSDAVWGDSEEQIVKIMGAEPSDSYEKDGGKKVLEYYDQKYEGYDGIIRYNLTDGALASVSFFIPEFNGEAYDHFNEMFNEKYGDPDYVTQIGQIWYEETGNVGLASTDQMGGIIDITFAPPSKTDTSK